MIAPGTSKDTLLHISEDNIRAALDSIIFCSTARPPSPLNDLLIVERFLVREDLPDARSMRDFALAQVLLEIITNEVFRQRSLMGRPSPVEDTLQAAEAAASADIQSGNLQLIDWDWLYYHYARPELNITTAHFARLAHIDERTVRRYQQRGIGRLTRVLLEHELQIRKENRRQRLYTALPAPVPPQLVGRRQALQRMREYLNELPPHHIQMTGPAGVGKTAIVQETMRSLIDDDFLEGFAWIQMPRSIGQIQRQLSELKIFDLPALTLSSAIGSKRLAIVLDSADALSSSLKPLEDLLAKLSNMLVFLTSRQLLPLGYPMKVIELCDLGQREATALIQVQVNSYFVERGPAITDVEIARLLEDTGGNPRKIQQAVYKRRSKGHMLPKKCVSRASLSDRLPSTK